MALRKFKLPLYLIAILILSLLFGNFLPTILKAVIYTISLFLKEILIFILPFMVFSFIFHSMIKMQGKSFLFIIILLPLVCFSNFNSTWIAYLLSKPLLSLSALSLSNIDQNHTLNALWQLNLPKPISNDTTLFFGLFLGILLPSVWKSSALKFAETLYKLNNIVLNILAKVIPLFILGFVLKLEHEGVLSYVTKSYSLTFILVVALVFSYITFLYLILNRWNFKNTVRMLRNMAPAILCGFSTMSSAASMPFTILGSKQNLGKPEISEAVIPSTVNIHLIGDCFAIPIFALSILTVYGFALPDASTYFYFAIYFVLAKFAVAAVPGGGILVMLPILEQHLGFSSDMLSLITALYIIFDPIITSANVAGNGAFAVLFEKTMSFVSRKYKSIFKEVPIDTTVT
jgi:Na+/H+-dicarboxylate symporter